MPDEALFAARAGRSASSSAEQEPCLITFTSGTAGEPKAVVHAQRYLAGQRLQAEHWLGAARRASSSGARPRAAGRSRRATCSSRRGCRAPQRCCTTRASIPHERLELLARERVNVLCMAPTEYRVIAKRAHAAARCRELRAGRRRRGAQPRGAARLAARRPDSRSATATARPRPAS